MVLNKQCHTHFLLLLLWLDVKSVWRRQKALGPSQMAQEVNAEHPCTRVLNVVVEHPRKKGNQATNHSRMRMRMSIGPP